jgi:trehalose 6-phosphate synthase
VLYRAADLCFVSPLVDGMNLVAKEYVACQLERRGVLLLSRFAGAAEELEDAVLVNPYDPEDMALRLRDALQMPLEERAVRMARLQERLRSIYDWMDDFFAAWADAVRGGAPVVRLRPYRAGM